MENPNAWLNTIHVTTSWECVCGVTLLAYGTHDSVRCECGRRWNIDLGQLNITYKDAPRDPAKEPGSLWQATTA